MLACLQEEDEVGDESQRVSREDEQVFGQLRRGEHSYQAAAQTHQRRHSTPWGLLEAKLHRNRIMYVCMECMYACIMHVCMRECMCVYLYVDMYKFIIFIGWLFYVCMCMYVCMEL